MNFHRLFRAALAALVIQADRIRILTGNCDTLDGMNKTLQAENDSLRAQMAAAPVPDPAADPNAPTSEDGVQLQNWLTENGFALDGQNVEPSAPDPVSPSQAEDIGATSTTSEAQVMTLAEASAAAGQE